MRKLFSDRFIIEFYEFTHFIQRYFFKTGKTEQEVLHFSFISFDKFSGYALTVKAKAIDEFFSASEHIFPLFHPCHFCTDSLELAVQTIDFFDDYTPFSLYFCILSF